MKQDKLVLIDGNSVAYRAFFALPLLSNTKGQHTNAAFGFTTMLMKLIEEEQPSHFLVAFDAGKITFRHTEYKEYKGKRAKTPPELSEQFPMIRELLRSFQIEQYELEGFEADDIIGTITRLADEKKKHVTVVTGDKDMLQLASEYVTIALTRKGVSEMEKYDPAAVDEKYGLKPEQIIDLKGLMGDTSDNIPGVPGIGEKTGLKLLHEYGSVENVIANVDQLRGKMKERIEEHAEQARMSKDLATIYREVPLESDWEDWAYKGYDEEALAETFRELEFKSLLDKMDLPSGGGAVEQTPLKWSIVDEQSVEKLTSALSHIHAVHVEVIGENPHRGELLGIAFADEAEAWFVKATDLTDKDAFAPVREWLADENAPKSLFDVHKVNLAFSWAGLTLKGVTFDAMLAGYLLDPTDSGQQTFVGLTRKYGVPAVAADEDVFGKGAKFKVPDEEIVGEFLCRKASALLALQPLLEAELEETEMKSLFDELELPLVHVLTRMETKGIKVDTKALQELGDELNEKLERIMQTIYEHAGTEFNINSPKQLGEILFEKLGLPVIKKTKTGYSTDAEVLDKLSSKHEIVNEILHYRQLAKLQSTYVEGLLKEVREDTSKVHTYFRQTIAATGRLSSQFPNLQNIPIRLEEGRKIRRVFTPEKEGHYILSADYSQIELRILAHLSNDERLIEAFKQNMDIHTKTAMDVFGVAETDVDGEMRRRAKAVNFGIVYGISDYGLSQNLNITRKEAAHFIEQYFHVFEGVRTYMDDIVQQAKKDGYVATLLHRRRYLPEINVSNFNKRSFAERTAMNTPIQGTAADVIKLAMVRMEERMKQENIQSRMLLQVHDELVFEVPEHELELMQATVKDVMEQAITLQVPLKVDLSYGHNWYEAD